MDNKVITLYNTYMRAKAFENQNVNAYDLRTINKRCQKHLKFQHFLLLNISVISEY